MSSTSRSRSYQIVSSFHPEAIVLMVDDAIERTPDLDSQALAVFQQIQDFGLSLRPTLTPADFPPASITWHDTTTTEDFEVLTPAA